MVSSSPSSASLRPLGGAWCKRRLATAARPPESCSAILPRPGSGPGSLCVPLGEGPKSSVPTAPAPRPKGRRGNLTHYRHPAGGWRWLMLPAMSRRIVLSLLGLALPICSARSAQAAGLPCQPCAGIRLAAPLVVPPPAAPPAPAASPAAGGAAATAVDAVAGAATPGTAAAPGPSRVLGLLRAERLPPGSPLFIAWEVPLATAAAPAAAGAGPSAKRSEE